MREIIILDYDEIDSAWDMFNAFKNNYGIFLDPVEGVSFFDTTTIHEFYKGFNVNISIMSKLHKLNTFADCCDKIIEVEKMKQLNLL